jgi:hypothetical protein
VSVAEKHQLLERTEEIEETLDDMKLAERTAKRVKHRQKSIREAYVDVMNSILDLCHVLPEGTADYEARRLLEFLVQLNTAINEAADSDELDPGGRIELTRIRMLDVVKRMERRIQHSALDNPQEAARFLLFKFADLRDAEVAELLGISTKTLGAWRSGRPIKHQVSRLTNLAQVVSYLQHSMTPRGIALWLHSEQDHLDGRTPLATLVDGLEKPDATDVNAVKALARGGRGQLAN